MRQKPSYVGRGRVLSWVILGLQIWAFWGAAFFCGIDHTIGQTRQWGTWYGGSGYDFVERNGVIIAADGSVVLVGNTQSNFGISTPGTHKTQMTNVNFRDVFMVRLGSDGVRQCATYYGGDNEELAMDAVSNELGDVYIVGATASNWPSDAIATAGSAQVTFGGGKYDAFLVKMDRNCRRVAGTYFGGAGQNGDGAYGVALGRDGIYVTGWTDSASGIATSGVYQTMFRGGYDAYLVKLHPLNHQVVWATYFGGEGYDVAHSVKVAEDGHVFIAGITTSQNHIATRGVHQETLGGGMDLFIAKFQSLTGQLVAATYVGGERNEGVMNQVALELSRSGYVYLLSDTYSSTGIATPGSPFQARGGMPDLDILDLCLVKLKQSDLKRVWGTYLGFKNVEGHGVMAITSAENIYIAVASSGAEDPTPNTFQTTTGLSVLGKYRGEDARLEWLTYFDGPIRGIAVNTNEEIAVAGAYNSEITRSGLPLNIVSESAHQREIQGSMDAFVVKFSHRPPPPRIVAPKNVEGYLGLAIDPVQFRNNSGQATRWNAVGLPNGLTIDSSTGIVTGTPSVAGIFNAMILAENDQGVSRFNSIFKISARPDLRGPEIVVLKLNEAMQPVVATNMGGEVNQWILRDKPDWMEFDARTGQITGIPTRLGTFPVFLTAKNPVGESTLRIEFVVQLAAPVITSPLTATGVEGNSFVYSVQAENATSVSVLSLPANLRFDVNTRTITGIPAAAGQYSVTLVATNQSATTEKVLRLMILPQVPEITSPSTWVIRQGVFSSFQITTLRPATRFSATGLPPGLILDPATGRIQGSVTTRGTYQVNVFAANSGGESYQALTIHVTEPEDSSLTPPVITTPDTIQGVLGSAFGFAINTEGEVTRYDATGLPPGLSVNNRTGYILGTPEAVGTYEVKLIASNRAGTTVKNLTITIVNQTVAIISTPVPMPTPTPNPPPAANFGSPRLTAPSLPSSQPTTRTFPEEAALKDQEINLRPASRSSTNQRPPLTPKPTPDIQLKATDPKDKNDGEKGNQKSNTKVDSSKLATEAPVIVSPSNVSGVVGQPLTYQIRTQAPALTYNFKGRLPEGLVMDEGTGIIRGTPQESGTFTVTVAAFNAKGNSAKAVTFTISKPPAPTIISEEIKRGFVNQPFDYQIRATGNPTGFQIDGALPDGLTFDAKTARISGTPRKEGRHEVNMIAINAGGKSEKPLIIHISKSPPPEIKTISSLASELGKRFEQKIEADQEIKTFLIDGKLPKGLQFDRRNGILSGTPEESGLFNFEIKAVNEAGTGAKKFTLRVVAPTPPRIISSPVIRGQVNRSLSYVIRVNFNADSFSIIGELPSGLQLDEKQGVISGRPRTAGTSSATLIAYSSADNSKAELLLTFKIEEDTSRPIRYKPIQDILNEILQDEPPPVAFHKP